MKKTRYKYTNYFEKEKYLSDFFENILFEPFLY